MPHAVTTKITCDAAPENLIVEQATPSCKRTSSAPSLPAGNARRLWRSSPTWGATFWPQGGVAQ